MIAAIMKVSENDYRWIVVGARGVTGTYRFLHDPLVVFIIVFFLPIPAS
jgi:hypothetical protein